MSLTGVKPSWMIIDDYGPLPTSSDPLTIERVKEAMRILEENVMFGNPGPPALGITSRVDEAQDGRSLRVSYEISRIDLHLQQHRQDIFNTVMTRCADALAEQVAQRVMSGGFDRLIDEQIKLSIRDEVKKAVADKVEDFIEEIL